MSSRNVYLNPEERKSALSLSRSLDLAAELYDNGERDASSILGKVCALIAAYPHTEIDYAQICDVKTMKDVARIEGECVLALAVRVGKTRLIDNRVFGESPETGEKIFHAGGR
jgi:pantoate--beta-alanine ligase